MRLKARRASSRPILVVSSSVWDLVRESPSVANEGFTHAYVRVRKWINPVGCAAMPEKCHWLRVPRSARRPLNMRDSIARLDDLQEDNCMRGKP